jgi:hypothetical protein
MALVLFARVEPVKPCELGNHMAGFCFEKELSSSELGQIGLGVKFQSYDRYAVRDRLMKRQLYLLSKRGKVQIP